MRDEDIGKTTIIENVDKLDSNITMPNLFAVVPKNLVTENIIASFPDFAGHVFCVNFLKF